MRLCLFALVFPLFFAGAGAGSDLVKDFVQTYGEDASALVAMPDAHAMGPVALVGHSRISADQVFELWTPVWSETQARVRNGKLSPASGDARLREEWERAVLALIKDELFFQEAEREHNSFINAIVDRIMRGGADRPRSMVASEVRRMMEQDMEKFFRMLNSQVIKESGGRVKLLKVLEGRGLTFAEWQNRLRKKAFTQSYLHQILKPRAPDPGPRQVQQYYASHPDEFTRPGVVRFRHVFFSNAIRGKEEAREDAIQAWEMLVDGEIDFETAAAQYSDDPVSAARGGLETEAEASDLEREAWLADIRTALREESPNEIGPVLESPFGCHVAVLLSIGPSQRIPFQEVRKEIEGKLQGRIWEEETDRYFQTVQKNTPIQVLMPTFPEHLSCRAQSGISRRDPRVFGTTTPEIHARQGRRQ